MVQKILEKLKHNEIVYAFLRNEEYFLANPNGQDFPSDIDILVRSADKGRIHLIMNQYGFIQKKHIYHFLNQEAFLKYDFQTQKLIYFDFHYDSLSWLGVTYLTENEILNTKREVNNLFVIGEKQRLVSLVFHCILEKRKFTDKYTKQVNLLVKKNENRQYLHSCLIKHFGVRSKDIERYILNHEYEAISNNLYLYITSFFIRHFKEIMTILIHITNWVVWKFKQLFKFGEIIAITGIDGSGKTTLIFKLSNLLKNINFKTNVVYMGRGSQNILPIQPLAKRIIFKQHFTAKKKKSAIKTVGLILFYFDSLLRYMIRILPKRIKGQLTISERYFSDFYIASAVPKTLCRFLYLLSPRASVNIFLKTNINEALLRKQEDTREELERQQRIYDSLIKKRNWMTIEATSTGERLKEIIPVILKKL